MSFETLDEWPIYIIYSVDKSKLSCCIFNNSCTRFKTLLSSSFTCGLEIITVKSSNLSCSSALCCMYMYICICITIEETTYSCTVNLLDNSICTFSWIDVHCEHVNVFWFNLLFWELCSIFCFKGPLCILPSLKGQLFR